MYLAQAIEYSVQVGRALGISFEWLLPLTGFRASESGIDGRIFSIIAIMRRLFLLRRDLPLLSLVSGLSGCLAKLLL